MSIKLLIIALLFFVLFGLCNIRGYETRSEQPQGKARQGGRSYHQETRETRERRKADLGAVDGIRAEGRARHFAALVHGLARHGRGD